MRSSRFPAFIARRRRRRESTPRAPCQCRRVKSTCVCPSAVIVLPLDSRRPKRSLSRLQPSSKNSQGHGLTAGGYLSAYAPCIEVCETACEKRDRHFRPARNSVSRSPPRCSCSIIGWRAAVRDGTRVPSAVAPGAVRAHPIVASGVVRASDSRLIKLYIGQNLRISIASPQSFRRASKSTTILRHRTARHRRRRRARDFRLVPGPATPRLNSAPSPDALLNHPSRLQPRGRPV